MRFIYNVWLIKDDLQSRLASVTGQLSDVETERDQLSTRLQQLQTAFQQLDQGSESDIGYIRELLSSKIKYYA